MPRAQPAEFEISLTSADYDDDFASEAPGTDSSADAELARYEAFLQREFSSSIRQELETRVDELLENAEENLEGQRTIREHGLGRQLSRL